MKNLLSILGAIGLTATSTTTLISCEKLNNNENGGGNKPEPTTEPQKPPENSNWKLIDKKEFLNLNNKWAVIILDDGDKNIWRISETDPVWKGYTVRLKVLNNLQNINKSKYKPIFYRWDGVGELQIPTINPNNREITDWKE
ncbi:lipoprotein [Spiroplasma endosymbiont of Ammophila pubescens]|uniref:lipoprotein n=1 Tax=Spiroplasma endosymbiont of Ammophila pubescens TaxID=3066315 RepID=UPI0032B14B84